MGCNFIDLTGMTYGRLTVIQRAENTKDGQTQWLCQCCCEAKTQKIIKGKYLRNGDTKSCGCLSREKTIERNKTIHKKYNDCVFTDKYVIMYTHKNEPFLVDIEDYGKVKDICWCKNGSGYLTGNAGNGEIVMLHLYIMDAPDDLDVDHKHGSDTKFDNRRSNLRVGTKGENMRNTETPKTNTSGYKGVYWNKQRQLWVAQIACGINSKNGKKKCYYLGSYEKIEDAIAARKAGEEKYFGEWSYDKSRNSREEIA